MARVLRPIEWFVLAFIAFVLVRVGPSVFLEYRELAGLRTVSVFCGLGVVGGVLLAKQFVSIPWPEGTERLARLHRASFALALLPMAAVSAIAVMTPSLWTEVSRARSAQVIPMVATVLLRIAGLGLPTLLVWLAAGLEMKRTSALNPRSFLVTHGAGLLHSLRDWAPLLFILSAYAWMDAVAGGKIGEGRDEVIASIDRALFLGRDPLKLLERIINQPLSEWLAFAYSFYAVLYPLVLGAVFMFGGRPALRESAFAVGAACLIGYVSYSLVPVKGPVLSRTFDVSLDLYLLASVKEAMMDATRITYDCFPSMHTCCTVVLAWCAHRHVRRLFWWIAPVVISMPFACVYLRYHYVFDVIAGLLLSAGIIWLTPRLNHSPSTLAQSSARPDS